MDECLSALDKVITSVKPPVKPEATPAAPAPNPAKDARPPMNLLKQDDIFLIPASKRGIPASMKLLQSTDGIPLASHVTAKLAPHAPDIGKIRDKGLGELTSLQRSFMESTAGKPFRLTVERKAAELFPNVNLQVDAAIGTPSRW